MTDRPSARCSSRILGRRSSLAAQARPARHVGQPGHVRGRDRRRPHHGPRDHRRGGQPRLVLRDRRRLAVAHRDLRQPRRGDRRGPRPGPGGVAARHAHDDDRARWPTGRERPAGELRRGDVVVVEAGEVIPATARSSRASRPSTSRPSRASPRRSSARPAATAAPSPAARACSPTASWSRSRRSRPVVPRPHDRRSSRAPRGARRRTRSRSASCSSASRSSSSPWSSRCARSPTSRAPTVSSRRSSRCSWR